MNTDPSAPPIDAEQDLDPVDRPVPPVPTGEFCGNCHTPLYGEHCFHCGQPDHGLVRHFSSVMGDLADTVLQIDTRLTRTLAPLLLRPGYLSMEYFAGRRVRYVSPVRLFFFISVVAFFFAQWRFDASGGNGHYIQVDKDRISAAMSVPDVQKARDAELAAVQSATNVINTSPAAGTSSKLDRARAKIRDQADKRIAEIQALQAAGKPVTEHEDQLTFDDDDGKPWDPVKNPLRVSWLPDFGNRWLNDAVLRARGNVTKFKQNPNVFFDAWISAMPSTLFLLLPLFATLLKVMYFFKRRLYMEHFIVALHSHAFLCFAFLLQLMLAGLDDAATASWMHTPIGIATAVLGIWMPLYLLLMQKRVYGQGWIMTVLKFGFIAFVYFIMLVVGGALTMAVKFIWL